MKRLHPGLEGAPIWDRIWTNDRYSAERERMRRAERRLSEIGLLRDSLPSGSRLIDLGCGSGENLEILRRNNSGGLELVGSDFSEKATVRAASRLHGLASVCRADVRMLPFHTASFTHATAFGVYEHIPDAEQAIAETMRVIKPGGRIYVTTSNRWSFLQIINAGRQSFDRYPYGFQRNWTLTEVKGLLDRWSIVEAIRIVHADWDMPVVKMFDSTLRHAGWGRYIYASCVRRS